MKSRIIAIITAATVLFSSLSILPVAFSQAPTAVKTNTVQLAGIQQSITIRRDDRGIPYIEAANSEDMAFAQGYATASDRLWQMDLFRRTQRGELSEVLTAGPNNIALEQDKQHRTLGFARVVEAELAQASPQTRALFEAYARGVNAYIETLDPKNLPPEFQILQYKPKPWLATDSLLIVKLLFEALSNSWRLDIMRDALSDLPAEKRAGLMPEFSPIDSVVVGKDSKKPAAPEMRGNHGSLLARDAIEALALDQQIADVALARIGFYAEGLAASNNWVVSGKRSVTGKPLLANDPHLAATAPSIWHMVHLHAPGVRVAGVTVPGLPGVVIGHNERIAWGFTNVGADLQDVYVENFDPNNPRRYMTPAGWRDAELRREEIKVRKGLGDLATDTVVHEVTVTRHGPIVFQQSGKRYALRWTAFDPKLSSPDSSFAINRAANWKDFSTAIATFTGPVQNAVYADVDGHIGYHVAGKVPIRKKGDGSIPYDGSTDDGEWVSFIPSDKLPQLFDPPSGMIVTANQRIVGTDYPYFLTHSWAQPYRARRINDLLNAKPKLSTDDFRRILADVYSIGHTTFARQAVKILRPTLTPADTKLAETLNAFEKWDGRVTAESAEAAMLQQMRISFRSRVLNAALGAELFKIYGWNNFDTTIDRLMTEQPKEWLPKEFGSYAELLRATHEEARAALNRTLGEDESKWKWGEMVKTRFQHPLAAAPLIGLQFTIKPIPQNGAGGLAATVNVGAPVSMRFIADTSDWDKTQHAIPLGQSGIPTSAHWQDQLEDWKAVTPRVFPFSLSAVNNAAKSTTILEPKKP